MQNEPMPDRRAAVTRDALRHGAGTGRWPSSTLTWVVLATALAVLVLPWVLPWQLRAGQNNGPSSLDPEEMDRWIGMAVAVLIGVVALLVHRGRAAAGLAVSIVAVLMGAALLPLNRGVIVWDGVDGQPTGGRIVYYPSWGPGLVLAGAVVAAVASVLAWRRGQQRP